MIENPATTQLAMLEGRMRAATTLGFYWLMRATDQELQDARKGWHGAPEIPAIIDEELSCRRMTELANDGA